MSPFGALGDPYRRPGNGFQRTNFGPAFSFSSTVHLAASPTVEIMASIWPECCGCGVPGHQRGLGIDPLGEQDAGGIEQWLPGDAKQPAIRASFELAVQPLTVLAKGEM